MISIFVFLLVCFSPTNSKEIDKHLTHENVYEILVPLASITPIMCDPIFNKDKKAIWYKNGEAIGRVSSYSNHVYEERPFDLKEIPEVGFLIIPNIRIEDQGDYWCELEGNDQNPLKVYRLRVAFIESFDEDQKPLAQPIIPNIGQTLRIQCPTVKSYPKALISWKFNDDIIDYSNGHVEVTQDGSLLIRRYQSSDIGVYSCTWSNFAGHTTTQIQLFPSILYSLQNDIFDYAPLSPGNCASYFRNGLLWFLIGCLSTSCVVLLYLMFGLFCYKYSRRSTQFAPLHSIFSADPSLAPGFRKVIAPVHDYIRPQNEPNSTQIQAV